MRMRRNLLDRLDEWKSRFGGPETGELESLLKQVDGLKPGPAELIRLHETLL